MAYYVIDVASGKVGNAFEQKRDALQYAEGKQTRIVTTEVEDDAVAAAARDLIIAEHIVEAHTAIDDRLEEIEERLDRVERDIDIIDGGY